MVVSSHVCGEGGQITDQRSKTWTVELLESRLPVLTWLIGTQQPVVVMIWLLKIKLPSQKAWNAHELALAGCSTKRHIPASYCSL